MIWDGQLCTHGSMHPGVYGQETGFVCKSNRNGNCAEKMKMGKGKRRGKGKGGRVSAVDHTHVIIYMGIMMIRFGCSSSSYNPRM